MQRKICTVPVYPLAVKKAKCRRFRELPELCEAVNPRNPEALREAFSSRAPMQARWKSFEQSITHGREVEH